MRKKIEKFKEGDLVFVIVTFFDIENDVIHGIGVYRKKEKPGHRVSIYGNTPRIEPNSTKYPDDFLCTAKPLHLALYGF